MCLITVTSYIGSCYQGQASVCPISYIPEIEISLFLSLTHYGIVFQSVNKQVRRGDLYSIVFSWNPTNFLINYRPQTAIDPTSGQIFLTICDNTIGGEILQFKFLHS